MRAGSHRRPDRGRSAQGRSSAAALAGDRGRGVSAPGASTPEYLRTFRGRFLYIYQAKGELRLDAETLRFSIGWQMVTIPLTSIRVLAHGDYPTGAKPAPQSYIGIAKPTTCPSWRSSGVADMMKTPRPIWPRNSSAAC
jgi:hypothetical protein